MDELSESLINFVNEDCGMVISMEILVNIKNALLQHQFPQLLDFSRLLRRSIQELADSFGQMILNQPKEATEVGNKSTEMKVPDINNHFLRQWCAFLPALTSLRKEEMLLERKKQNLERKDKKIKKNTRTKGKEEGLKESSKVKSEEEDEEDEDEDNFDPENEFVEQEGCPDETDFNRWSHHCR